MFHGISVRIHSSHRYFHVFEAVELSHASLSLTTPQSDIRVKINVFLSKAYTLHVPPVSVSNSGVHIGGYPLSLAWFLAFGGVLVSS